MGRRAAAREGTFLTSLPPQSTERLTLRNLRSRRSSCAVNSGVSAAPKSSGSKTWRISISDAVPAGLGHRSTHSIASSFDLTCQIQKPAMSSLVSVLETPVAAPR
jgi:hypothetical protein